MTRPPAMIMRGRLVRATRLVGGRLLADVEILAGELRTRVEILLPPGTSARPSAGADVLLFAVGGARNHLIGFVDDPANRILDLGEGEWGVRGPGGQLVAIRADGVEIANAAQVTIVSSGPVLVDAPEIRLGSGAVQPVKLANNANATKVFAE